MLSLMQLNKNFTLKAVIFDVDGTLYDQKRLRQRMLVDIFTTLLLSPGKLIDVKILWNFRKNREKIITMQIKDIERQQYLRCAKALNVPPERVRKTVHEWMFEKPLRYLKSCQYKEVKFLFKYLRKNGVSIGIFSDYPAKDKLNALDLSPDIVVCSTDQEVDRLKPDPRGLLVAAEKLKLPVNNCLFVGDRDEKDGECARRAGMRYLILDRNKKKRLNYFQNFVQIKEWLV